MILAEKSVWNSYLKIVQYTGGPSYYITGSTAGAVEETDIQISQVEKEISDGMYVITGANYPKDAVDFVNACSRYLMRLQERSYHVVFNNCEHLANHIMNGNAQSEQIDQSCTWKKAFAHIVDMLVNDGKSNFLRTAIETICSTLLARWFVHKASKQVLLVASKKATSNTGHLTGTLKFAHKVIVYVADNYPSDCTAEQMLCSQQCCDVAETAGNNAFFKTELITGGLTLALETTLSAWKIFKLNKMRKADIIKNREFYREILKAIVTVIMTPICIVAGGYIAETVFPVPFLGWFVGELVENLLDRLIVGVFTAIIIDVSAYVKKT